jgi:RNA-directed DNA polymerase
MNDPEKSDFGIVAVKPTNKAGRPVAELVERRPGTKGNAEQQRMHRTQGWDSMSHKPTAGSSSCAMPMM